ncbi:SIS domain-containing protein [Actinomadura syzygii]|uniref:SIS domain-containing protein n=1 Tax=Actinomadura syzygii TaxID=1427538 RepID=A0A5D0TM59_9ACTN|nr:SIS domain-containing protein [Actinomadura syzygii]TYC07361.1 SIS domain-containing protein [Actinomadura syzygii]
MNPESLYPFLSPEQGDGSGVLADVRASTEEKAAEIVALRESLADLHGERLVECARRMAACFEDGGRLFAFGNGGSGTDARQIEELHVGPPPQGRPLPAVSLPHDVATVTALSNDVSFDVAFARQLAALAGAGDIAMGLSTSGGSENLLRAFAEANRRRMLTVGFAGYDGGRMAQAGTVDYLFVVPSSSVHRIQEAQTTLYHVLWELTQWVLRGRS